MPSEQTLYISTKKAAYAVKDKNELDCLAFAVMGKLMLGCSVMVKSTIREYKSMFRMGTDRFKRILNNCISRGYITDCDTHYRFNRIKEAQAINMVVTLPRTWGKNKAKQAAVTLNQVKDYIRKVVQYDKFDKKQRIENAIKAKAFPKSVKTYKKAQRLCKRISNTTKICFKGRLRGVSMMRISQNMQVCKAKAHKLIQEMVKDGWITNTPTTIRTDFDITQFNERALQLTKEMGWHGSYYRVGSEIYCKVMNIYELSGMPLLKYINKN